VVGFAAHTEAEGGAITSFPPPASSCIAGSPQPPPSPWKRRASISLPPPLPLTEEERKGRRRAIFGEPVGPSSDKVAPFPVCPKSPETRKVLEEALKDHVMFSHLECDERMELFDAMSKVHYGPGDIVIKQGEDGDFFYVVERGTCEIWRAVDGSPPQLVLTVQEGGTFGELALIYGTQRAATVKAKTAVALWAIHRSTYRQMLMEATLRKRSLHESFLKNVPILAPLERYERLIVADALEAKGFNDGDVIITEGSPGDAFYILTEGQVRVTQNGTEVARLRPSDYFGEIALLTDQPRRATVTSVGTTKCLKISRDKFFRVMGPCQEVLKRNMARLYPNIP